MFSVKHNECVGFESRWKVKKISSVGSSQTTEYSTKDMDTHTAETKDIEVQTDSQAASSTCDVDEERLAAWLKRIYPAVKKELDSVATSRAFKGYRLSSDSSEARCRLVQTVDVTEHLKDADIGRHVAALSWNATNQTLAVSCTYKHTSWCYHEGLVLFYMLDMDDYLPKEPRNKLPAESCVTVLQFHTTLPSVVAGGLFSGSIIVWNLQEHEEQVVIKVDGYSEGITQLSWIRDISSAKNILLASSSLDGLLTFWDFNMMTSSLVVKERHQIRPPILPKSGEVVKKTTRGITCFDFSKHSPEMFVVGAEGGLVVQCSMLGSRSSGDLVDSTLKYYEPHKGDVGSVAFSPNRKDMFMSSGSDLEIRIYMIGQEEPAQVIFPKTALNSVVWVPFEERIICGCGKSGLIEIFQLVKGKAIETTSAEKIKIRTHTLIEINKMKSNIVAVGTDDGNIQMWRVPWALFGNIA